MVVSPVDQGEDSTAPHQVRFLTGPFKGSSVLVDVRGVVSNPQCSKPNCQTGCSTIHRHHRRSQHMWVRHFARRRKTQRYKDFRERYRAFLEEDIVRLCHDHHEEAHAEYREIIRDHIAAKDFKPLRKWTWEEAEKLGDALEAFCGWWLKQETPGIKVHRLT